MTFEEYARLANEIGRMIGSAKAAEAFAQTVETRWMAPLSLAEAKANSEREATEWVTQRIAESYE